MTSSSFIRNTHPSVTTLCGIPMKRPSSATDRNKLLLVQTAMSGRERSGTYSSLCENEEDFVPPVRSYSITNLSDANEIELGKALRTGGKQEGEKEYSKHDDACLYGMAISCHCVERRKVHLLTDSISPSSET